MELAKGIVRAFSYVYHGVLALFLVAVSGLTLATAPQSLHLDMLPWTGATLAYTVFFAALFGLAALVLAVNGKLRALFFVWCLAVTVLMIKGYFFSGYRFEPGGGGARKATYLILGSLLALLGGWWQMMRAPAARRY